MHKDKLDNIYLKAIEEYKNRIIGTLITEFNVESDYVGKVLLRSVKCHYIVAQIEKLMKFNSLI